MSFIDCSQQSHMLVDVKEVCMHCIKQVEPKLQEPLGLFAICGHSSVYPQGLLQLPDAPTVLYIRGSFNRMNLLERPCVAVVGSRKATPYGLEVARELGSGLAAAGVTVISGMAFGVDAAAHRGALDADGPTVAVLAGGADYPYPRSNRGLYSEICATGLAVSEYSPGTQPCKWSFPARNRIMAGLSEMAVVVEAAGRSGSLITADIAASIGKEVGAVPGPVNSRLSEGTNSLIADGAKVVSGVEEILAELEQSALKPLRSSSPVELDQALSKLLSRVESGYETVDSLTNGGDAGSVVAGLTELELLGLVKREPDGSYVRTVIGR